uniref:Uncharacterized protein n=1 Tax=Arundo donax TaxID=35708 RepID=A0A0A9AGB9_ARUDO
MPCGDHTPTTVDL